MAPAPARSASLPIMLLAAVAFLSSCGGRIVDPLLAAIATDFHSTIADVSVIIAAFVLPYGLNQIILGPIGDRYGKLRVLLCALVAYTVFTASCALATDLPSLTMLRACAGAASAGLIPVCLAYIGDSVPYDMRQITISRFLGGAVMAQTAAGPLGGLFGDTVGWRGVFLLLAACGAAVAAFLALRIRSLPDRRSAATFQRAHYATLAKVPRARRLLLATVVEGAVLAGSFPFLAPYLSQRLDFSYSAVGLLLACFGLGAYGYTRAARWLIASLGEAGQVLLGGTLMTAALVAAMAGIPWWGFILIEATLGFGYFTLHAVMQARATELLPDARSTAVSTFVFLLFTGQAIGALAIGRAIGAVGYHWAFIGDAALVGCLTLWLTWFMHHTRQDADAS